MGLYEQFLFIVVERHNFGIYQPILMYAQIWDIYEQFQLKFWKLIP